MDLQNIRAVIFDMDGVLIDSEGEYLKFCLAFARTKNPEVTIEQLYGIVGNSKKNAWTCIANAVHNGQTWEELRDEYHRTTDVFSKMDYPAIFRKEALDVLKELEHRGYRLALASSTQMDIIERVLTENHIKQYFELIVSGDQFKQSKPDPEIYHYTASRLGLKEEECFVVEDSTVGITAASRAGMTIAALIDERYGFEQSLADYKIHNLLEILHILPNGQ